MMPDSYIGRILAALASRVPKHSIGFQTVFRQKHSYTYRGVFNMIKMKLDTWLMVSCRECGHTFWGGLPQPRLFCPACYTLNKKKLMNNIIISVITVIFFIIIGFLFCKGYYTNITTQFKPHLLPQNQTTTKDNLFVLIGFVVLLLLFIASCVFSLIDNRKRIHHLRALGHTGTRICGVCGASVEDCNRLVVLCRVCNRKSHVSCCVGSKCPLCNWGDLPKTSPPH